MISEITEAISFTKTVLEAVKSAKSLTDIKTLPGAVEQHREKLVKLLSVVAESEESKLALIHRVSNLTKENEKLKDWDRDSKRYQLYSIASGVNVFSIKPGMEQGEPPHHLCAKCYNERKKSYLQRFDHNAFGIYYRCDNCKSEIIDHSRPLDEPICDTGMGEFFS